MFDIHQNFTVKAPAKTVFEAFTKPHLLDSWWTLKSEGKPEPDNVYTFYFGPEYDWRAKVIKVIPGSSFMWQMTQAMDDWVNTKVGFELREEKAITQVHFFHLGWAEASEHFGITTYCWGQLLNSLKKLVEEGTIIPFAERN